MLALTLVAVCAAVVAVGRLQAASAGARDAQLRLTALRLDVAQIQDVPWGAAPGGDEPADVRNELSYDAQSIAAPSPGCRPAGRSATGRRSTAGLPPLMV